METIYNKPEQVVFTNNHRLWYFDLFVNIYNVTTRGVNTNG